MREISASSLSITPCISPRASSVLLDGCRSDDVSTSSQNSSRSSSRSSIESSTSIIVTCSFSSASATGWSSSVRMRIASAFISLAICRNCKSRLLTDQQQRIA